ncbi:MAG: CotH kinase family protein [Bacteroidota bacterium]
MKIYLFTLFILSALAHSLVGQQATSNEVSTDIQDIKIKTENERWRYVLDSLRVNGDGLLEASVSMAGSPYQKAAFRYRDFRAFTPGAKRNPLYIKLEKAQAGHQEILLSHALRDPSMLRELLAYQIIGTYMPAPKVQLAKVYVNEEFYALLVQIEPTDESYLKSAYGSAKGTQFWSAPQLGAKASAGCKQNNFAALQYDASIVCYQDQFEADGGWNELRALTKKLADKPNNIEDMLAVDEVLWMLALNNVLVNLDSYTGRGSQNYGLFKAETGMFHPMHGAMNLAFGSYKNTGEGSDLTVEELIKLDPMLHAYSDKKPLIRQLLSNDRNRKIYISHMRTILEDYFWSGKFEQMATALHQAIAPILEENDYNTARFEQSLTATTGTRSKVPGLVDFMNKRAAFLKKHPILTVLPSNISEIKLKERAQFSSQRIDAFEFQVAIDRFPKEVAVFYRFQPNAAFQKMTLQDDGGTGDETADDGIYGGKIMPKGNTIEYYIFVENSGAITFSPTNYPFERRKASLEELNR